MNLSAPFILRPIATTLISIGIAIAGIIAFNFLPVSSLPQIEFPTILVQASLSGASSEVMASSVTTPIEKSLSRIAGIADITSSTQPGKTQIIVQFDLSRSINGAASDVQSALDAAQASLPSTMTVKPSYRKVNPADSPIIVFALTSNNHSQGELYDIASTVIQQKLLKVEGVGQVIIAGSSLPAVRVELDPDLMAQYNISLNQMSQLLSQTNSNLAKGEINNNQHVYNIVVNDQLFTAKEYQELIVKSNNSNILRLKDIAKVTDSVQDIHNSGIVNNKDAVLLVVFKSPNTNVVKTNELLNKEFFSLKSKIASQIDMKVVMNRTVTIKASLFEVKKTLCAAIIFVLIIVYLFLGSIRSVIIPGVAMVLSLLGTFAVMWLLGYSLNILSLMALTIATGFVVDDAIVVLENITRYLEKDMEPKSAALIGSKEIGFTVTSISLSLVAVFIPILLMGGVVGRLFREFAVTLSVSIIISLIISLTISPMMCAHLLKKQPNDNQNKISFFEQLKQKYQIGLQWALNHQKIMLFITFATIILNIYLIIKCPKGFFPQQDTGRIVGAILTDQKSSFQSLNRKLKEYLAQIKNDPAVENVVGFIASGNVNSATVFVVLTDLEKRKISSDKVIARIREKLKNMSGATLYMQTAQDLVLGGRQSNAQFQYSISGNTVAEVNNYAPKIMNEIKNLPGIVDVNSDQGNFALQSYVNIDYDKASALGISIKEIDSTLYAALGQKTASNIYKDDNQYSIIMGIRDDLNQTPDLLEKLYFSNNKENLVPIKSFAQIKNLPTLLTINHQSLSPSATISFNLVPNMHLGDAVASVNNAVNALNLPISISGSFRGMAQAFQSSLANEPYLILAALLTVYIILGMLYENFTPSYNNNLNSSFGRSWSSFSFNAY
jgi:multidrug efflux pump